ncbi:MAG: dethiobiotin synthase [Pseudomonadota bacterium]
MSADVTARRRGWVILATDTGVGKTFVGEHLARALVARGLAVRVRKPVESGCEQHPSAQGPTRFAEDAERLRQAAGCLEAPETVCPLRLRAPLAPPEAARREGRSLILARDLLPALDSRGTSPEDIWLVEGAGGLHSPLSDDALNLELATATGLPVILVAEDRLGTLSATLSALEALDRRGIPVDAVVLNRHAPHHPDAPDNLESLGTWIPRIAPGFRGRLLSIDRNNAKHFLAELIPA